jgi:Zn-dependent protease
MNLNDIFEILVILPILFFAVVLHEYAHGWVAYRLGDPTAKLAGRLTLNPLKHIDLVGTILLPAFLIILRVLGLNTILLGWAKPVPVDFFNLRHPKRDMIWVGLAGPAVNVVLAILFSQLLKTPMPALARQFMEAAVFINLLLAAFNMIPIPPLDGSRLVTGLLPRRLAVLYNRLERYGILIVIILIYLGLFDGVIVPAVELMGKLLGVSFA